MKKENDTHESPMSPGDPQEVLHQGNYLQGQQGPRESAREALRMSLILTETKLIPVLWSGSGYDCLPHLFRVLSPHPSLHSLLLSHSFPISSLNTRAGESTRTLTEGMGTCFCSWKPHTPSLWRCTHHAVPLWPFSVSVHPHKLPQIIQQEIKGCSQQAAAHCSPQPEVLHPIGAQGSHRQGKEASELTSQETSVN